MKQFEKIEVYKKIPLYETNERETMISYEVKQHIINQVFPNLKEIKERKENFDKDINHRIRQKETKEMRDELRGFTDLYKIKISYGEKFVYKATDGIGVHRILHKITESDLSEDERKEFEWVVDNYGKYKRLDKLLSVIFGTFEYIDEAVKHYPFLLDFVTPTHCEEKILADGLDVIEWAKNR